MLTGAELEPMPSIPALPPAAPSFAQRLNADTERPQTAPIKTPTPTPTPTGGHRKTSEDGLVAPMNRGQAVRENQPLPPPLPLVLRPPLRKKKSFSRVSTWLFPGQDEGRNGSFDSVTNKPKPVKSSGGFYQVVSADGTVAQRSCESIDSLSTWETEDEERTALTTWSPESTPAPKQEERTMIERRATFGKNDARLGKPLVGVAM